jgi:hypothetical protein
MLGDVDGDGMDDAIVFFEAGTLGGSWYVALSNGTGFGGYSPWKEGHGMDSTWQAVGDTYGNGQASPVAFQVSDGSWKVMPADIGRYIKPNTLNTWESGFGPQWHLTNFIDVDEAYIRKRAQAVASRIAEWNKNPTNRPIKYAIAIGAMQFTHNPKTMESEASKVLNMFVNNPEFGGPENYFYLEGKPLLVFYTSKDDRNEWEDWGNKSQTNHFTVRWAQGTVPINNFPPPEEYGLYYSGFTSK